MYKDDLAAALEYSRDNSGISDAVHLSKAAKIVRSEVVQSKLEFTDTFPVIAKSNLFLEHSFH